MFLHFTLLSNLEDQWKNINQLYCTWKQAWKRLSGGWCGEKKSRNKKTFPRRNNKTKKDFFFLVENCLLKTNWNFSSPDAEVCLRTDGFAFCFLRSFLKVMRFARERDERRARPTGKSKARRIIFIKWWMQISFIDAFSIRATQVAWNLSLSSQVACFPSSPEIIVNRFNERNETVMGTKKPQDDCNKSVVTNKKTSETEWKQTVWNHCLSSWH